MAPKRTEAKTMGESRFTPLVVSADAGDMRTCPSHAPPASSAAPSPDTNETKKSSAGGRAERRSEGLGGA